MMLLQKHAKCISEVKSWWIGRGVRVILYTQCRLFAARASKPPPPKGSEPPKKKRPLEATQEEHPYRLDRWTDWKMKKDYLRRQMIVRLGRQRMMLDTLHNNDILPREIRELAQQEVEDDLPRDSKESRLSRRCALTSRPRAIVEPWRVSRLMFRHLADYNKLTGVQRAIW